MRLAAIISKNFQWHKTIFSSRRGSPGDLCRDPGLLLDCGSTQYSMGPGNLINRLFIEQVNLRWRLGEENLAVGSGQRLAGDKCLSLRCVA